MRLFMRQTLLWKYAATLSALVSTLLVAAGALQAGLAWRQSVDAALALQQLRAESAYRGELEPDIGLVGKAGVEHDGVVHLLAPGTQFTR